MLDDDPTVEDVLRDYHVAGHFLVRRDASPKNPSPVISMSEFMEMVRVRLAKKDT